VELLQDVEAEGGRSSLHARDQRQLQHQDGEAHISEPGGQIDEGGGGGIGRREGGSAKQGEQQQQEIQPQPRRPTQDQVHPCLPAAARLERRHGAVKGPPRAFVAG
jgi:hypothetical protein